MYFSFVRGRQYELLALRELVEQDLLNDKIMPVIEPVKLSSTLFKTMERYIEKNRNIGFICNPSVGSFVSDMKNEEKKLGQQKFFDFFENGNIIKSHIMKKNSENRISAWNKSKNLKNEDWLIICNNRDFVDIYNHIFSDNPPKYVLLPDDLRRKIRKNRVLFEDKFEKCARNSDYQHNNDEFFSEDHLYYSEDGYMGFGDYSVIGENYLEAGFAPYAVAIHIVYFDTDKTLRVHHFVSDSNDDIQNPAKKFYEAVEKLATWEKLDEVPETRGLKVFLEHYHNQSYPGLGSVKKLSLMHHLELVGYYLDGEI